MFGEGDNSDKVPQHYIITKIQTTDVIIIDVDHDPQKVGLLRFFPHCTVHLFISVPLFQRNNYVKFILRELGVGALYGGLFI